MATTFRHDCPHCGVRSASFAFVAEVPHVESSSQYPKAFTAVFSCPDCHEVIGVRIRSGGGVRSAVKEKNGNLRETLDRAHRMVGVYPDAEGTDAPEHISPAVARCLYQANQNAELRHWDASGAMFRKCLDLATKELDPTLAGLKLNGRINKLHEKGLLTDALKDWAHLIRLDGNDASHDEDELTDSEIKQLRSFTELFLLYTFTLPKQVTNKMTKATGASSDAG